MPSGVLAAVPFQTRNDVAKNRFELKLYNGTDRSLPIVAVQLVWDGMTTEVSPRENALVAGGRLDYPVPLTAATCAGDGTVADMPDPNEGIARVLLADGSELQAPVFDTKHFARKLYLEDCERQRVAAVVEISWVDLHEISVDGRPATEGTLRLTRRADAEPATITIGYISNSINFNVVPLVADDDLVVVVPTDRTTVEIPVRFVEGRCDSHARSESSQPFAFVAQVDLGDGDELSYPLPPPADQQVAMRNRVEQACDLLGVGFAGTDDAPNSVPTTTG